MPGAASSSPLSNCGVTEVKTAVAQEVVTGANVDLDQDVYVVELHGRFVGSMGLNVGCCSPRGNCGCDHRLRDWVTDDLT